MNPIIRNIKFFVPACLPLCLAGLVQFGCSSASLQKIPVKRVMSAADQTTAQHAFTEIPEDTKQQLLESYGKLPLSFEANQGQSDSKVKFISRGHGYTLFLTDTEAVLTLKKADPKATANPKDVKKIMPPGQQPRPEKVEYTTLRMRLEGAKVKSSVSGLAELPGKVNYFIGNDPTQWHTNILTYAKVRYAEVYPGIDLVYYGNQRQLEYDLVVQPGADPNWIKLAFEGAEEIKTDTKGDLILNANGGELHLKKPLVYQEVNGTRQPIAAQYVLQKQEKIAGLEVRVKVAAYDAGKPLIIDPVLSYSTYLGGSNDDVGYGIAVDGSGSAYVTGYTFSTNFPTVNALQATNGGSDGSADAFVAKLNPAGSALVYSTYLGGSGGDSGHGIAVDVSGNAYIIGQTFSSNFPTANALQAAYGGGEYDAFVAKLNPAGSMLVYSTYLGGSGGDIGQGIAVDGAGNAYVTGATASSNFPTANALQAAYGGGEYDAFVAKLNPVGSALVYSTYLGGNNIDAGTGIAVDSLGNAFVTGGTASSNFPTANALQAAYGGGEYDAFVAKLDPVGSALVYSTYLGGNNIDAGTGIAVDSLGNAFVTGGTASSNFPTANALQAANGGGSCSNSPCPDAFVVKLNAVGSALNYSTYVGGSDSDESFGIAVDGSGNAYVTGWTFSTNFPTANALQPTFGGNIDAFVAKLDSAGSMFHYSTYLGGSTYDEGFGIAVDGSGNAYVTGYTQSTNFPTANALQPTMGGIADVFVAKISDTTTTTTTTTTSTTTTTTTSTTTTSTTTTTVRSTLSDVGIRNIDAPKKVDAGKTKKVEIEVKNFSNTTQTRSLRLTLNGVLVSGSPRTVTLTKHQEVKVKFNAHFAKPGTSKLKASLSPADVNPGNDVETETVRVKSGHRDDKDDHDDDGNDDDHHEKRK